jgi:hypothetical protein
MQSQLMSPSIKIHDDERENIFNVEKSAGNEVDHLLQDSVAEQPVDEEVSQRSE